MCSSGGVGRIRLSNRFRKKYLPRIHGDGAHRGVRHRATTTTTSAIIQRYRLRAHPGWNGTVAGDGAGRPGRGRDRLPHRRGRPGRARGRAHESYRNFSEQLFADYPDVDHIVVTPQQANRASCRVLEKAGYELRWTGQLDSDDPADAGTAALYLQRRP